MSYVRKPIKSRPCNVTDCQLPVFAFGLCKCHQHYRTDSKYLQSVAHNQSKRRAPATKQAKEASAKPKKAIKQYSKKRSVINKSYSVKSRLYIAANPLCIIHSPHCTKLTQGVHHVKGKATIELLLDDSFWLPACNACNTYIEANSQWAKDKGFKLPDYHSKLSKFKGK